MRVNDRVRFFEGEWFSEGRIIAIDGEMVDVDFLDWIQRYKKSDLVEECRWFQVYWVPRAPGVRIKTFS